MAKKKTASVKKSHKNIAWIVPLLLGFFFISAMSLYMNKHKATVPQPSTHEITAESIKPQIEFSLWEQGKMDPSDPISGELLSQLSTVLASEPHKTEVTSDDMESATLAKDTIPDSYVITVKFTDEGKAKLLAVTERNIGKSIAVVVNGRIVSVNRVQEPVSGGSLGISGKFTEEELNQFPQTPTSGE